MAPVGRHPREHVAAAGTLRRVRLAVLAVRVRKTGWVKTLDVRYPVWVYYRIYQISAGLRTTSHVQIRTTTGPLGVVHQKRPRAPFRLLPQRAVLGTRRVALQHHKVRWPQLRGEVELRVEQRRTLCGISGAEHLDRLGAPSHRLDIRRLVWERSRGVTLEGVVCPVARLSRAHNHREAFGGCVRVAQAD